MTDETDDLTKQEETKSKNENRDNNQVGGSATGRHTVGAAWAGEDKSADGKCDPDEIKRRIYQEISNAKLEAVVADLEKLLETIEVTEKNYDEKYEQLDAEQTQLCDFVNEAMAAIEDCDQGAFSRDDKEKVEKIVADAVCEVTDLRNKVIRLKGFMPIKISDEGRFKFGRVAKAKIRLNEALIDHEATSDKLKELIDLAGGIGAKHAKLGKMKADITKRIAAPRELATFCTAWWLINQKNVGGKCNTGRLISKKDFFIGLLKSAPKVIEPKCLAEKIYQAWEREAVAKAKVYRLTRDLQHKEDRLKKVEKKLADAEASLIKKIIKEIEAWDCIRLSFPEKRKEQQNA